MKENIEVTIYSPINVLVYYGSEEMLLMSIDLNSGRDYNRNYVVADERIKLVFKTESIRKEVEIEIPDDKKIKFFLGAILTESEILSSFSREEAIKAIGDGRPTSYSFEQMAGVGLESDIPLLKKSILTLGRYRNSRNNYLIARGVYAIGEIGSKYSVPNIKSFIEELYETYPEKETYGHYFESAIEKLG